MSEFFGRTEMKAEPCDWVTVEDRPTPSNWPPPEGWGEEDESWFPGAAVARMVPDDTVPGVEADTNAGDVGPLFPTPLFVNEPWSFIILVACGINNHVLNNARVDKTIDSNVRRHDFAFEKLIH